MATRYICKCGREVSKSTNSDNTGNRDTTECTGCPYLLPWGQKVYTPGQGFHVDVQGYECRMSPTLEYRTELSGSLDDKTTIRIASLDFDFLECVSNWVQEQYPDGELSGAFSRDHMRAVEYVDAGRYRYTLSCAQNKKGIAAKRALWAEFFDETFHRKDLPPDSEKQKILCDIQRGKDEAAGLQAKEEDAMATTYRDPKTDWLYRVSPKPDKDGLYKLQYLDQHNSALFKTLPSAYEGGTNFELVFDVLAARAAKESWVEYTPDDNLPQPCERCICPSCAHDDCTDAVECTQNRKAWSANQRREECFNEEGDCPGYQPRPISSAAPTVAADQTVEAPALSAVDNTTAEPAAQPSAEMDDAINCTPALTGGSAVAEFDYSGLDAATSATLKMCEADIRYQQKTFICNVAKDVIVAHAALAKHGYGCFGKWCEHCGIAETTARRLLDVGKLFDSATVAETEILRKLPSTLLYAAAKPSAPAEAVAAVKSGDVKSMPEYKALLAEIEAERAARKKAEDAQTAAEQEAAELSETAINEMRRANAAEEKVRELESRPIETTATDADELDRLATEKAQTMTEMYKAQITCMQEQNDDLARQLEGSDVERYNHARDIVDAFILQIKAFRESFWRVAGPLSKDDFKELIEYVTGDAALLAENDWSDFEDGD